MEKLAQNIQEAFLNNARKDKTFLTIYLMSGVKLSGRIKSFDKYSVVLETNNQEQLIFKHAISTVVVSKPFHASAGGHPRRGCRAPPEPACAAPRTRRGIAHAILAVDERRARHPGRAGSEIPLAPRLSTKCATSDAEESLEEMKSLADTAGAHVEETIVQVPASARFGHADRLRQAG